ncbi:high affinity immunoglobulin gamma Fc receptor I-like [Aulostomus maculatus]
MDMVVSLLVLSTLPQFVVPGVLSATSLGTFVEIVSGHSRVFSGETVRLKCYINDNHNSNWDFLWYRGSELLLQKTDTLILWRASIKDGGEIYCQGVRNTIVGKIYTLQSVPVEINVDGGWVILHSSMHHGLVGETLEMTCRVRRNPQLHEAILYKDGIEIMRKNGLNSSFSLPKLTLKDQGLYSCRASWDEDRQTHSAISAETQVQILEVLTQPILEIVTDENTIPSHKMKLICHLQYNFAAPAPPVVYYFYKDNNRLGLASSENHAQVKRTPGVYSCRARVPQLDTERWSETKSFGQESQGVMPPSLQSRDVRPFHPPILTPDSSLTLEDQPTTTLPSPQRFTATLSFSQPPESTPPLKSSHSKPVLSQLLFKEVSQSLLKCQMQLKICHKSQVTFSEKGDDIAEESGDMSEQSGDSVC